ncbi:MAG: THUMP domain-containing protein [Candidatus Aenigmatarchaeota archaeon]
MDANLLVTFDPNHIGKASEEVKALLEDIGDFEFLDSNVDGVFLLKTKKDSKKIVKELKEICKENPKKFEYTFHWVPIERWCKSTIEDMIDVMKDIDNRMDPNKSWKMDLNKRNFKEDTMSLIIKLTDHINKPKVDLKNPQQIVKVEILGDKTGISLLDADELLDIPKIKREFE